jgi:hypothetical protein
MLEQVTIKTELPDLPLMHCAACNRGVFRAAAYGIISVNCQRCAATTVYIDGFQVFVQGKNQSLRRAIGVDASTSFEDMLELMKAKWADIKKTKANDAAAVAVGLRFDVFMRDKFTCRYCGKKAEDGAVLEADHVIPRSAGGADRLDNLVTACWECNRGKSAKSVEESFTAS